MLYIIILEDKLEDKNKRITNRSALDLFSNND